MSGQRLKFLVVEDHPLVREGVRLALHTLEADVTVLEAGNAEEATRLVELNPELDMVLLDVGLPDASGFSIFERLHRRNSALPIMMLSASADRPSIMAALRMGAAGFISKASSKEIVLEAIRLALAGGVYIPPQALGTPPGGQAEADPLDAASLGLTSRELQVLALLAQGKPNKIIARELQIAERTVKAHLTDIFRALKVTNRAQAVIAARKIGFA